MEFFNKVKKIKIEGESTTKCKSKSQIINNIVIKAPNNIEEAKDDSLSNNSELASYFNTFGDESVTITTDENEVRQKDRTAPGSIIKDDLLVESVEHRPALWDICSKDYKNRLIRPKLWEEICLELNLEVAADNVNKIKKRWDYLRSAFFRSKNVASGSATKKPFQYERIMRFLEDKSKPRSTKSIFRLENDFGLDETSSTVSSDKSKPTENFPQEKLELTKRLISVIEKKSDISSENSFTPSERGFANIIIEDMRVLPMEIQRRVRIQIFEILQKTINDYNSSGLE